MMQDRYLYRAKRTDNGEWVEGFYFCMEHTDCRHTHHFIMPLGTDLSLGTPIEKIQVEVAPSTICQCAGLPDKHKKPICENDIVKDEDGSVGVIKFGKYDIFHIGFYVEWITENAMGYRNELGYWAPKVEVIGNVFDERSENNYLQMASWLDDKIAEQLKEAIKNDRA